MPRTGRGQSVSKKDKKLDEALKKRLSVCAAHADVCADCSNFAPQWASANLGIFLCARCAGIHRSIGTHISQVRSLEYDVWTPEQVELMERIGNHNARFVFEHKAPSQQSDVQNWIRQKYIGRLWFNKDVWDDLTEGLVVTDNGTVVYANADGSGSSSEKQRSSRRRHRERGERGSSRREGDGSRRSRREGRSRRKGKEKSKSKSRREKEKEKIKDPTSSSNSNNAVVASSASDVDATVATAAGPAPVTAQQTAHAAPDLMTPSVDPSSLFGSSDPPPATSSATVPVATPPLSQDLLGLDPMLQAAHPVQQAPSAHQQPVANYFNPEALFGGTSQNPPPAKSQACPPASTSGGGEDLGALFAGMTTEDLPKRDPFKNMGGWAI